MEKIADKDELIASLQKQLKEVLKKCSALEHENALLSSMIAKCNSVSLGRDNNGTIKMGVFNSPVITNIGYLDKDMMSIKEIDSIDKDKNEPSEKR